MGRGSTPPKSGKIGPKAYQRPEGVQRTRVSNSSVVSYCEPSPSTTLLHRTRVGATPHTGGTEGVKGWGERTRVSNSSVTTQCEPSSSTTLLKHTRVGAHRTHKGGNEQAKGRREGRGLKSPTLAAGQTSNREWWVGFLEDGPPAPGLSRHPREPFNRMARWWRVRPFLKERTGSRNKDRSRSLFRNPPR